MKFLGIDYGRRRIGLALSDETGVLAHPLPAYRRSYSIKQDLEHLTRLARVSEVKTIVIGLPLNMDGSHGEMANEAETFARRLEGMAKLPVVRWDERLTSQEAERVLLEGDVSRRDRKRLRDGLAATLILQGFLDGRSAADQTLRQE